MNAPYHGHIAPLMPPPECGAEAARWSLLAQGTLQFFGLTVYQARLWAGAGFEPQRYERLPFVLALDYQCQLASVALAERALAEMRRIGSFSSEQASQWLQRMRQAFPDVRCGDRLSAQHDGLGEVRFAHNGLLTGQWQDQAFARLFFGVWFSNGALAAGLLDAPAGVTA